MDYWVKCFKVLTTHQRQDEDDLDYYRRVLTPNPSEYNKSSKYLLPKKKYTSEGSVNL